MATRHPQRPPSPHARAAAAATLADSRWAAVRARDARADGTFCYSVSTTGVFCTPSCGARRPRPEHVGFHASAAAAAGAGYRPCRRCRPDEPPLAARRAELVASLCRFIDAHPEPPTLATLARRAGSSPHHVHRLFREVTGVPPRAYAAARRAERVAAALQGGRDATTVAYDSGFGSYGRFHADAVARLGMSPSAFRSGGEGQHIRHAGGRCSLGRFLVATTDRGVCAILIGDDAPSLLTQLTERFPRARLSRGGPGFARTVAEVAALVERPWTAFPLPLDVQGTVFQQRVWEALRRVPPGTTRSYSAIAADLGSPGASRAVASACAANALAIAIPCHRVVRRDGQVSGYRWGASRKRALLDREERAATLTANRGKAEPRSPRGRLRRAPRARTAS